MLKSILALTLASSTLPVILAETYNAIAVLKPTDGQTASAIFTMSETDGKVLLTLNATGLVPGSTHGFHIHSWGDISDSKGTNFYGHYNPTNKSHYCPGQNGKSLDDSHIGDLANFQSDKDGNAFVVWDNTNTSARLTFDTPAFVVGRGINIHNLTDDCVTQPTGNAGVRLAIGVIGWKNGTALPPSLNSNNDDTNPKTAIAVLAPTTNSTVSGIVKFYQKSVGDQVVISLDVKGLVPGSVHGVHIHKFGDLTSPTGDNAGPHFNPYNTTHACLDSSSSESRHAGDLGNMEADSQGQIQTTIKSDLLSLYRGYNAAFSIGHAMIIHADKDDCVTQPTGNAGRRLSQGVIGYRNGTLDHWDTTTTTTSTDVPHYQGAHGPLVTETTAAASTATAAPSSTGASGYNPGVVGTPSVEAVSTAALLPTSAMGSPKNVMATYTAVAVLIPTEGNSVKGLFKMVQKGEGEVSLTLTASGLTPGSTHGFHIHNFGDISDIKGANLFGHYNPYNKSHGCASDSSSPSDIHTGDLGNVEADSDGNVHATWDTSETGAKLLFDTPSLVIGRGVVIHSQKDDCVTQPTGDSGSRLATGVIGWSNGTLFPPSPKNTTDTTPKNAIAVIQPTSNSTVCGTVKFLQKSPTDPVLIAFKLSGLVAGSRHGIHVHVYGDITSPTAETAGGHFNPFNTPHGCLNNTSKDKRHAGDLGNFDADTNGRIETTISSDLLSLYRGLDGFAIGHSLIVHADPDDCVSNPAGNSGKRLGQGVIGYRNGTLDDGVDFSVSASGSVSGSGSFGDGATPGIRVDGKVVGNGDSGSGDSKTSTSTRSSADGTIVYVSWILNSAAILIAIMLTNLAAVIAASAGLLLSQSSTVLAAVETYNAIAVLLPTQGSTVSGTFTISESTDGKVSLTLNATGLVPGSTHGFHIHNFGDITDSKGANLFGHYNPTNKSHACVAEGKSPSDVHVGDLSNIKADEKGNVYATWDESSTAARLMFDTSASVIGRGVVIHNATDDCATQPTGNAGSRLSTGVIGWKNATSIPASTNSSTDSTPKHAIVVVTPTTDSTVSGYAKFIQNSPTDGVQVSLNISGLAPGSKHGVHVHIYGDLTSPLGTNNGGHFNPFKAPHGCLNTTSDKRHAGDLGNLDADNTGRIETTITSDLLSLYRGYEGFALGHALIVHADPDDCITNPAGNSGKRLAQGVIGYRNATLDVVPTPPVTTTTYSVSSTESTNFVGYTTSTSAGYSVSAPTSYTHVNNVNTTANILYSGA
ncbi:hypothetical protein HDU76_008646, partial [Blyttiomyces sp. JEL0837]